METLIPIFLLLCLLAIWQLYHLHLLYTQGLRPALAHATAFLHPLGAGDANPTQHPHDCGEHLSLVPTPLDGIGRPGYFARHAHRARDLENLQVGSYAAGNERWWTAGQARAKREFVDAWTAGALPPERPLDQDQLRYLFARLDAVFFSGALTQAGVGGRTQLQLQRGAPHAQAPVRLDVVDWDPYSLRRIRWGRRAAMVAYTDIDEAVGWVGRSTHPDNNDANANANIQAQAPSPPQLPKSAGYQLRRNLTITLARRFNGQELTKAEQLEALCRESVRAFLRLYWEWCPAEAVGVLGGGGGDGRGGPKFHVVLTGILRTIAGWHATEFRALTPGGYRGTAGAGAGRRQDVLRHFGIATAPRTYKRLLVLAVIVGLNAVQPWWEDGVVAGLRRAGGACVAFWRENRWTGVLFVMWCLMMIRALCYGLVVLLTEDDLAPETWVLTTAQALR